MLCFTLKSFFKRCKNAQFAIIRHKYKSAILSSEFWNKKQRTHAQMGYGNFIYCNFVNQLQKKKKNICYKFYIYEYVYT